ncbi:hypothetical protein E2C01_073235 [Portunus trituberculatus]|uniref:Uncharacterized protein n=1 Tax=Portunus trituberculatus TaxID=210409 RepID=A0A5B7ICT8_PORTR|nr:hypothetical protein [Portunus trituberculatus]
MEAVDSLAARARGALTTAFSFRKSSRDKGAAAAPVQEQAVTHLRPPRPHSGRRHAPHSDFIPARELTRPRPRQEGGIRGLHEGVQRYQYLPPNPHTVGVPVPELHHPHPHSRHGHHPSHQAPLATRALPTIVLPPANLAAPKEASRLERRRSSLGEPLHERPLPLHLREGRRPSLDPNVLLNTQPYPEDRRGQYVTAGRGCRPAHPKRFTPAAKTGGRRRSASPPPATRRRQETDRRRPKNGQFVSARKNPAPSAAPGKPASGVWTIQIHPPTPDSTPVPSHATTPTPATATCSTTASPGRLHTAVLRLARWRLHMKQTAATHWAAVKKDAPTVEEVMEALGQAQVTHCPALPRFSLPRTPPRLFPLRFQAAVSSPLTKPAIVSLNFVNSNFFFLPFLRLIFVPATSAPPSLTPITLHPPPAPLSFHTHPEPFVAFIFCGESFTKPFFSVFLFVTQRERERDR